MGKHLFPLWSFVWWHDIERQIIYENDISNIQLISQWIVWYCMLQKNIQNYDLRIVNRRVACKR